MGSKLRCVPDITIPLKPENVVNDPLRAAIVPNYRMVRKAVDGGRSYMDFLRHSHQQLSQAGLSPLYVIHETAGRDRELAVEVSRSLGIEPETSILEDEDPLRLKGFLAGCALVVSSRYHACVGALSSGVPVLSLGWTHKYNLLHDDFGVPELVLDPSDPSRTLGEKIRRLLAERDAYRQRLEAGKACLYGRIARMWDDVFSILGNTDG